MTYISRFSDFAYILKTIWCMNVIVRDNESVWHNIWPQNKCRSLWPIFHDQWCCLISWLFDVWTSLFGIKSQYDANFVTVTYISWSSAFALHLVDYLICCMNIMLWDYESVWPDVWPPNKCWSMWSIFHGPMILSYISKTIWCMSVIFSDNDTVWPKLWPQCKYKPTWAIFHGLVILLNVFKIIWWLNIIVGIMDQCDT